MCFSNKSLDFWLYLLHSRPEMLGRYYSQESFLQLSRTTGGKLLFLDVTTALEPLAQLPFRLEYHFEYRVLQQRQDELTADCLLQRHVAQSLDSHIEAQQRRVYQRDNVTGSLSDYRLPMSASHDSRPLRDQLQTLYGRVQGSVQSKGRQLVDRLQQSGSKLGWMDVLSGTSGRNAGSRLNPNDVSKLNKIQHSDSQDDMETVGSESTISHVSAGSNSSSDCPLHFHTSHEDLEEDEEEEESSKQEDPILHQDPPPPINNSPESSPSDREARPSVAPSEQSNGNLLPGAAVSKVPSQTPALPPKDITLGNGLGNMDVEGDRYTKPKSPVRDGQAVPTIKADTTTTTKLACSEMKKERPASVGLRSSPARTQKPAGKSKEPPPVKQDKPKKNEAGSTRPNLRQVKNPPVKAKDNTTIYKKGVTEYKFDGEEAKKVQPSPSKSSGIKTEKVSQAVTNVKENTDGGSILPKHSTSKDVPSTPAAGAGNLSESNTDSKATSRIPTRFSGTIKKRWSTFGSSLIKVVDRLLLDDSKPEQRGPTKTKSMPQISSYLSSPAANPVSPDPDTRKGDLGKTKTPPLGREATTGKDSTPKSLQRASSSGAVVGSAPAKPPQRPAQITAAKPQPAADKMEKTSPPKKPQSSIPVKSRSKPSGIPQRKAPSKTPGPAKPQVAMAVEEDDFIPG